MLGILAVLLTISWPAVLRRLHAADFQNSAEELQTLLAEVRHHAIQSGQPQILRVRFDSHECEILEYELDELDEAGIELTPGRRPAGHQQPAEGSPELGEPSGEAGTPDTEHIEPDIDPPPDGLPSGFRLRKSYRLPPQCVFARVDHRAIHGDEQDQLREFDAPGGIDSQIDPPTNAELPPESGNDLELDDPFAQLGSAWSAPTRFLPDGSASDFSFLIRWRHRTIEISIDGPTGVVEIHAGRRPPPPLLQDEWERGP